MARARDGIGLVGAAADEDRVVRREVSGRRARAPTGSRSAGRRPPALRERGRPRRGRSRGGGWQEGEDRPRQMTAWDGSGMGVRRDVSVVDEPDAEIRRGAAVDLRDEADRLAARARAPTARGGRRRRTPSRRAFANEKGSGVVAGQPAGGTTSSRPARGRAAFEVSVTSSLFSATSAGQTSRSGATATSRAGAARTGRRTSPRAWSRRR